MGKSWFLSYNSRDEALAKRFVEAFRQKKPDDRIFFAPVGLQAGGYWLPELAKEIGQSSGFILLVGESGVGPWQVMEYYEALDRRVKQPDFPLVFVLQEGQLAPGLPFLRQLHWIVSPDPASDICMSAVVRGSESADAPKAELWKFTAPYRGLAAMTESDSDYFFGRSRETVETINALAQPGTIPILLGNSGVGKSSLARAGVLAALRRQCWPDNDSSRAWPIAFGESRQWCFLTLRPATEPVTALVEAFLENWQLDRTGTDWPKRRAEWVDDLLAGKVSFRDLLDQTRRRFQELQRPEPPAYFIYIDQGEELYARSSKIQRSRFSEMLGSAVSDPRLHLLISLRSDFFGELQRDSALFAVHRQVNVPPLREAELRDVVTRPAQLLGAKFETEVLGRDIARRTAEESTVDAGALPLLSYLLDDMWRHMVTRSDGILRLPAQAIELGGVLVERANSFLAQHPGAEDALRRTFTLKLANVREDGEPTRRRAYRSDFSDEEWHLICELADFPNRLLNVGTPTGGGETYVEVSHEAIFRRWEKVREWVATEREFLSWRATLEQARRTWRDAPEDKKEHALLMGLPLLQAQGWLDKRREDISESDREFIFSSIEARRKRQFRQRFVVGALAGAVLLGLTGWAEQAPISREFRVLTVELPYQHQNFAAKYALDDAKEKGLGSGTSFRECARDCPMMVVVPSGNFEMGSNNNEPGHQDDEVPVHRVVFAAHFAVSRFPVTFGEWQACVAYGNCRAVDDASSYSHDQPVINVSWQGAQTYAHWLSQMTGKPYHLLSEAEYEYAARGGRRTAFWWADAVGTGHAVCVDCGTRWDNAGPAPVQSLQPNPFGLFHMEGNIWEWVEDCYHPTYRGAPVDGSSWTAGGTCTMRVVRGGSWRTRHESVRAAMRDRDPFRNQSTTLGFRVARDLSR